MTRITATLATLAALGLAVSRPAAAQTVYYPSNATISAPVAGTAQVGLSSTFQPSSPTVSLVSGGSLSGSLFANNGSTVFVSGGSIGGTLTAVNTSKVTLSGGTVGSDVEAQNNSTVTVTGGTVTSRLAALNSSQVVVSGGTFGRANNLNFFDDTNGSFTFIGTGISDVSLGADSLNGGTDYLLAGLLQDGQSLSGDVINVQLGASMFQINPAPEPSPFAAFAVGLLGLGALAVKAKRRTT